MNDVLKNAWFVFILTLISIIVTTFGSITLAKKADQYEMKTYKNDEYSFTVQYPKKLKPSRLLPYQVFHAGGRVGGIPTLIVSVYTMGENNVLDLNGFFLKIKELYPAAKLKKTLTPERNLKLSDGTMATVYTFSWDWPISGNRKFMGFQYCIGNDTSLYLKSAVLITSKDGKHYSCMFTTSRAHDSDPPEELYDFVASFDFY